MFRKLFGLGRKSRDAHHRYSRPLEPSRRRWLPQLEGLEQRYAPSCSTYLENGFVLRTACDGAHDYYSLDRSGPYYIVNTNGAYSAWSEASVRAINFYGANGDDRIEIMPTARNLDYLQDPMTVSGSTGMDWLKVYDEDNGRGDPFAMSQAIMTRPRPGGTVSITFPETEIGEVFAGSGSSFFDVRSASQWLLHLGPGNDSVYVGTGSLDSFGSVYVDGGPGSDGVVVRDGASSFSGEYTVTSNRVDRPGFGGLAYVATEQLSLFGAAGNNRIQVNSTLVNTTINAGYGNDTIHLGTGNLSALAGAVVADGYFGTDVLHVNDGVGTSPYAYSVSATAVTRPGFQLTYGTADGLVLNATGGPNRISVGGTPCEVTINAGRGDDQVTVGNGNLGNLPGRVTVNGDVFDFDTVSLDDGVSGFGGTYTLTAGAVTRAGFGGLVYNSGIDELGVAAAAGNNAIEFNSNSVPTTVDGGGGNDSFYLAPHTNNLNVLPRPVVVRGGAGTDLVELEDHSTFHNDPYTVSATVVTRPNFGGLAYETVESLSLYAGNGSNAISIAGTSVPTFIDAAAGNDLITVGSPALSLTNIQGPLVINGQSGSDLLDLDDQATSLGRTYTLSAGALERDAAARISWAAVETVLLTGGGHGNTMTVAGAAAGTAVGVNAGNGHDTVALLPGAVLGTLTVDGQGGTNALDYSAYGTDVTVILPLFSATDVAGGAYNIQNVTSGSGHDVLVGDDASNVLDGGAGRDVLIGGGSGYLLNPDTLLGGGDEDILIAGFTAYDQDTAALDAIRVEWTQPTDYWTRAANLYWGNGVPALNEGTVFYNYAPYGGSPNTLVGGADLDWFFGDPFLDVSDWDQQAEWFLPVF